MGFFLKQRVIPSGFVTIKACYEYDQLLFYQ